MKVALLDSGIGGWSFLTKIEARYPEHTYLYYADQKNCPYGNKTLQELENIACEWIALFKDEEIDILILACNTLTAIFKEKFQTELNIPVIGTTDGLENNEYKEKEIVLLATVKTAQSGWYERIFTNSKLSMVGNTWLAATIEERFALTDIESELLKLEVENVAGNEWDAMILGCTHYPLIKEQLKKIWPRKHFIDPAETIVDKLAMFLTRKEVNNNVIMYTSGDLALLEEQVRSFFDEKKQKKISSAKIRQTEGGLI
ncbi:glutamate racemase [Priestia aryabhattai]